jgi:beta-galactosidase/beta-glucuronidase
MTILSTCPQPIDRRFSRRVSSESGLDWRAIEARLSRPTVAGKFLQAGDERFRVKGVSYGTFAPDAEGHCFPSAAAIAHDFALMRAAGVNTVRTYTVPDRSLLDLAQQHGLRVMVGVPWADHVAFLDDRRMSRAIRRDVTANVRTPASHPGVLLFALGNEIPAGVFPWPGPRRADKTEKAR